MHQMKFGEYYFRTVVLDLVEAPKKTTVVSLAVLLEPNEYNMVEIDVFGKRKALQGYLGEWKFSNYDYIIKGKFLKKEVYIGSQKHILFDKQDWKSSVQDREASLWLGKSFSSIK